MIFSPYKNGDETQILSLFSQCFGRKMPETFWRWRFLDNPINQVFIQLAWDDMVLAAHYAASPVLVSIEGTDYLTSLSVTTMTHPKYRGLKLFPKLATQVYDRMAESRHIMIWGFPNYNSHSVFVKDLDWTDLYEIPTMQLKIAQDTIKYKIDILTDDHFDLDYSKCHYSRALIHVKKDQKYLQWRYAGHPNNNYTNLVIENERQVSSFCVVKKYKTSLDIVDFCAQNQEEGRQLLFQIQYFARLNNLDVVNCWVPCHHFLHSLFEKIGFINKEPITYLGFRQLSENKSKRVPNNYSDWYIQMGDSDVY